MPGITVLKNNVPWGPFTRGQIDEGLARGDFTLQYLAHASGLREWLPLGEVLHHVDERAKLPPVPDGRNLPKVPDAVVAGPGAPKSPPPFSTAPAGRPAVLPEPMMRAPEVVAEPEPPAMPSLPAPEKPEAFLRTASFFRRFIAFGIDGTLLGLPILILYLVGALNIEIPGAWNHIDHESRMEAWKLLERNVRDLSLLVAIGVGWLYGAGLEASRSQATLGKRLVGIRVTDARGERLSFLRATGRHAAKYLSALPCFLGFIIGLFSSRGLTLHDRLSDTRVVRG